MIEYVTFITHLATRRSIAPKSKPGNSISDVQTS